ncbi:MAG: efflux RND transporter permease subunit [Chryseolinea sp.]
MARTTTCACSWRPAAAKSGADVTALPLASGLLNPVTGQPEMVAVGQVATVSEGSGTTQINRRNLYREVLFAANVSGRPAGDVGADIEKVAATMALPVGYRIVTQGANNDMKESVGHAATALLLGALFIYMLLAVQFNSFLHPLTIMTSLPLSLVGVFGGLILCHSTLNVFSLIGMLMLMGLVTKNAILLVDFVQKAVADGMDRTEAILSAGRTRLRPILMTTAAMIAGMIPLALGLGEGAEQRAPMAHALIGGLLTSTVLTLVVVPVMYTLLDDLPALLRQLRKAPALLPLADGKTVVTERGPQE